MQQRFIDFMRFFYCPQLPEQYQEEFVNAQTILIRQRISLFCLLTLVTYYFLQWLGWIIKPADFKMAEVFLSILMLIATLKILNLNHKVKTLESLKRIAFSFVILVMGLIFATACLYAGENDGGAITIGIYLVFSLFFISFVIPWSVKETIAIGVVHVLNYLLLYSYLTWQASQSIKSALLLGQSVETLTLIIVTAVVCAIIRLKDNAVDIENFVLLKEVEEKNQQIQDELEVATRVHKTLIPSSINTDKADVTVSYLPLYDIGGDYAKFHFLGESKLVFIICDVTGHGVPAALLVNRVHAEFEQLAKDGVEPGALLKALNQFIAQDFDGTGMYLSAFCGLLNFENGKLLYSNYGHPPQYVYRGTKREVLKLSAQSTFLGIVDRDEKIYQNQVDFSREDRIFLFTDGVIEAENANKEQYGANRVEVFLKQHYQLPGSEFHQMLIAELKAYTNNHFRDDVFLLSIKVH